jgi:hypothetical protein
MSVSLRTACYYPAVIKPLSVFMFKQNNSTDQLASWEGSRNSANQEFPNILLKLEVLLPCSQETSVIPFPEPD